MQFIRELKKRENKMNKVISFTIYGNQEDSTGNPLAYARTTQSTQWTAKAKRYNAWKDYVRAHYLDAVMPQKKIKREDFGEFHDFLQKKPITATKDKVCMNIVICWKDDKHSDPDNVFKGIADALFMNDKYLGGSMDFVQSKDKRGSVKVEIIL